MTIHIPSQSEQPISMTDEVKEAQPVMSSQQPDPQSVILPKPPEEEEFFYFEEEQPDLEAAFVDPFKRSSAMPTISAQTQSSGQSPATSSVPTTKTSRMPRFSLTMIAILVCVVVIIGLLVMNALAQTTPPQTHRNGALQTPQRSGTSQRKPTGTQQKPRVKPTSVPTVAQTNGTNGQRQTSPQTSTDWVPQQLPDGWTNAGLLLGDGIQALRTAVAFNDREMSLDSRSVGTRNNHGGTFTAATFVMTPAAKQRFLQNDIRESNNVLFDMVVNTKLIRLVVNPQPHLIKFTQQGQQQFAWVDVAFQLWQSQIDPNTPQQRIEGKELDPTTKQPRVFHMTVLLLRVPPQDAGNNPAMGGTGWLVSNYALDLPGGTALDIVQPA